MKKLHWTQTPAGKARLKAIQAERKAQQLDAQLESLPGGTAKDKQARRMLPIHSAYVFGRTEAQLEAYARTTGAPFEALAQVVASLLAIRAAGGAVTPMFEGR